MNRLKRMLLQNVAWSDETAEKEPEFFQNLAMGQSPEVLWIGCSDSRVPAETVTHTHPGELFVHRNIANIFSADDDNAMSVLEYAVKVLKVSDIVVCGHYGCGGVKAALFPPSDALPHVSRRIASLCSLALVHQEALALLPDIDPRINRLAELNVYQQVDTIRDTSIVREAHHAVTVHGWIFSLHDGRLIDLNA